VILFEFIGFFQKRQKEPLGFVRIGGFAIVNNKKQEQI